MNRAKALAYFKENHALRLCEEALEEFHSLILKKRDEYTDKLLQGFTMITALMDNEMNNNQIPIVYINFSYLLTHILDGQYIWYITAQDENGYLDELERSVTIEMSEFFTPLEKLEENLKKESSKYMDTLTDADIEAIKLAFFKSLLPYLYTGAIKAFQKIEEIESYKILPKGDVFVIMLGEYMGEGQLIFAAANKNTPEEQIKELLYKEADDEDLKNQILTHGNYSGFQFESESIVCKNIAFSSLIKVRFEKMDVLFCNLMGTDFSNAFIQSTSINGCTLCNSDFSNASLTDTHIVGCNLGLGRIKDGTRTTPGIYPVSFQGASLTSVSFESSDLRGSDFRGASLNEVDFSDAILNGVYFDKSSIGELRLSEHQKRVICTV